MFLAVNSGLLPPGTSLGPAAPAALSALLAVRNFATTLASARGKGTTRGKNITWRAAEGTWVRKILNLCVLPFDGRENWRSIEP